MKRALFIKTKNHGDAVVLTSAIRAISPTYIVDVLCFEESVQLYTGNPQVDCIWGVKRGLRGLPAFRESWILLGRLRSRRYDLLCHFSDHWRGALISRFLGVRLSVAAASPKRPSFWHKSFTVIAKRPNVRRHAAELDVDLLRAARVYVGETPAYIPPQDNYAEHALDQFLGERNLAPKGYVVLHLASRWAFKELSIATARDLVRELSLMGYILILSGDESDDKKIDAIINGQSVESIHKCTGKSLPFFSELLKNASLLISVDSLAIHLASAHQVPIVAVFGPSGELNWRPWNTRHFIVEQGNLYPCRPCGMDGCAGSKVSECLRTLPATRLVQAVQTITEVDCGRE